MVESTSKHKSLSADSELSSAYDLLNKGEYSQCNRIIKKKMPKLKSAIDKTNFNIVKILLLDKTKRNKEKIQLLNEVKSQFLSNQELISHNSLVAHFKRILRSFNDDKGAQDLFNLQMKKMHFLTMDQNEQNELLKELTINFDFKELYSKVSSFIKTPNDANVNYLLLLKYEAMYCLTIIKFFSTNMLTTKYTELIKDFDKLKDERGYFDLIALYTIAMNKPDFFLTYFEAKRIEFTNAPIEDLKYDIYLSQGKVDLIFRNLIDNIIENRDKCNFKSFERIINIVFWFNNTQLKEAISVTKVSLANGKDVSYHNIKDIKEITTVLNGLLNLFEDIKTQSGRNLNSFKSGVLAQLLLFHNMIISTKSICKEIEMDMFNLVISILDKAFSKHSILFEISKYFIYFNDDMRKSVLDKYSSFINEKDIEKNLFYLKLRKVLSDMKGDANVLSSLISELIEKYLEMTVENIQLEKGERIPCDDLIVLANEYYYENSVLHDNNHLTYSLVICNIIAHEKSPYNYDISYYLLKTYSHINLSNEALNILQYMNMKGPQFETSSYIAFPAFIVYSKGMKYLIENNLRWQNDNREKSKSTLWKMFTGRNFWNSQEILQFINANQNSYYTILLEFFNLLLLFSESYFPINQTQEETEENRHDYLSTLKELITSLEEKEKNNSIMRNQDLLISIHKYCYDDYKYFNYDYDLLMSNDNYSNDNYRFKIDSLNKENNYIYHLYPGYKNNFFKQNKISIFGSYDNIEYLKLRMHSINLFGNISSMEIFKELLKKYISSANETKSEIDILISQLSLIMVTIHEDICLFEIKEQEIYNIYSKINETLTSRINDIRKKLAFDDYKVIKEFIFVFNEIKEFYCVPLTAISSKFLDLISQNRKKLKDANIIKAKLNESFKSPFINMIKENIKHLDFFIGSANKKEVKSLIIENTLTQTMTEKYLAKTEEINSKIIERIKDIFKEIKDYSKRMEDYIKQLL